MVRIFSSILICTISLFAILQCGDGGSGSGDINHEYEEENYKEPKLIYYSSMNSLTEITRQEGSSSAITGTGVTESFSNGYLHRYHSASASGDDSLTQAGVRNIYPTGSNPEDFSQGTLSMWLNLRTVVSTNNMQSQTSCTLFGSDRSKAQLYFMSQNASSVTCYLYINNKLVGSKTIAHNTWFHVYAVWGEGLEDNKTMRVFINKSEALFTSELLPDMSSFNFTINFGGSVTANGSWIWKRINPIAKRKYAVTNSIDASLSVKNLKLWNGVISEDPETGYNND